MVFEGPDACTGLYNSHQFYAALRADPVIASTPTARASWTAEEQTAVIEQLERLVSNPFFSHSRRFPSFLRFVVEQTLSGQTDCLKERTLGIEIFGKPPDYDTASDPIVRVTATEVRKRIAQYYQEPGHAKELRIALPPGSYVPQFLWPQTGESPSRQPQPLSIAASPELHSAMSQAQHLADTSPAETSAPRRRIWWSLAAAVLLASLAVTGLWLWRTQPPPALNRFWAPLLASTDPIVICFPQSHLSGINLRDATQPEHTLQLQEDMSAVVIDDLHPLVSLSGLLELRGHRYTLLGEDTATLTDLRQGPAIYVGAFDNAWTLRATRNLRFRFGNDPGITHLWIEDSHAPAASPRWSVYQSLQRATNNYKDYAIVARFQDPTTGRLSVVAAGIARGGTIAAGEFLTQPGNMDAALRQAPRNWAEQNMEFVLSTEIIDGRSAPPKVEASYFW